MSNIITNTIYEVWNLKFKNNRLILNCSIKESKYKCFNILEVLKPTMLFNNREKIIDNYSATISATRYNHTDIYIYKNSIYFHEWKLPDEADNEDIIKFHMSDTPTCEKLHRELIKVIRMVEALASNYIVIRTPYDKKNSRLMCTLYRKDKKSCTMHINVLNNTYDIKTGERKFTFYHMKVFRNALSEWKYQYNSDKIKYYILYKKNIYDEYVRIKPFRHMRDISKFIDVVEDITTKYKDRNILLCIFPIDKL